MVGQCWGDMQEVPVPQRFLRCCQVPTNDLTAKTGRFRPFLTVSALQLQVEQQI